MPPPQRVHLIQTTSHLCTQALPDAVFEQQLEAMGVADVAEKCRMALQAHGGQNQWAGSGAVGGHTMP